MVTDSLLTERPPHYDLIVSIQPSPFRTVTVSGQGVADQFQVCQTVAEPLVAGRFHSLESQTRPPDDGSGSGVAPE